jgi:hypothetical protein
MKIMTIILGFLSSKLRLMWGKGERLKKKLYRQHNERLAEVTNIMSELQTYWKLSDDMDKGQFSTQSGLNDLSVKRAN